MSALWQDPSIFQSFCFLLFSFVFLSLHRFSLFFYFLQFSFFILFFTIRYFISTKEKLQTFLLWLDYLCPLPHYKHLFTEFNYAPTAQTQYVSGVAYFVRSSIIETLLTPENSNFSFSKINGFTEDINIVGLINIVLSVREYQTKPNK